MRANPASHCQKDYNEPGLMTLTDDHIRKICTKNPFGLKFVTFSIS